ncbi:hypothetical protein HYH03_016834 [Edaphochlamys debaryana]|uniref:Protein kinase domain-containing protein n=1 Tax=Edaphochlamys debaryana TaxID=47281 RepID=A0A836BPS9_9CHLO|nr:hypothetical protein HYH03_016834 [Edaphochlamys debaryana]|eukprot:KAG2484420.1 hypothetical protein HYH03_016834 [Edaphochlamys debaryana]
MEAGAPKSGSAPPASPLKLASTGWAPAHLAACAGSAPALRSLHRARPDSIAVPAGEQAGAFSGWTPLHCAVACGEAAAVGALLDLGASLGSPTDPAVPIRLATSRDAWLGVWQKREQLPRFPDGAVPREDGLRDMDAALCSFARVAEAWREALARHGLTAAAEAAGMRPWDFVVGWAELERVTRVATGGLGQVSSARYRGMKVAVKNLHQPDNAVLQQEFAIMRSLPYNERITQVVGTTTNPHTRETCIVMAWYPLDLQRLFLQEAERLKGARQLTPLKRLRVALELAEGLLFLHSHKPEPIVHRDVKPDNVLLTDNLHVRITDFGISKSKVPEGIQSEQVRGSPLWMAPELTKYGPDRRYGTEVDVYGWGVIFCQLVSCKDHKIYELLDKDLVHLGEGRPPWNKQLEGLLLTTPEQLEQLPGCLLRKLESGGLLEYLSPLLRDDAYDLARDCLALRPEDRPAMATVVKRLRTMVARQEEEERPAAPLRRQVWAALLTPAMPARGRVRNYCSAPPLLRMENPSQVPSPPPLLLPPPPPPLGLPRPSPFGTGP